MSILKKYMEEHKVMVLSVTGSILTIAVGTMIYLGVRKNAYTVSVEGKVVGIIKTKEEAQSAYDEVVTAIDKEVGKPFVVNEKIEVEMVHASRKEVVTYDTLKEALDDVVSYQVEAYEVLVDDVRYAVVGSKEEATKILETLATRYAPNNGAVTLEVADEKTEEVAEEPVQESGQEATEEKDTLEANDASSDYQDDISKVTISNVEEGEKEVEKVPEGADKPQDIQRSIESYNFNEEIVIRSCFVDEEEILSLEEGEKALAADRHEIVDYELVDGDNIWDIAVAFDTTQERILDLNPEIEDETKMQIGQKIKVEKGLPILSITTVEKATFKELIPGKIQYKPSEQFYEGFTKVIVEGNDGVKELTVEVTKVNGEEVSRQTLSEKVLSEAKVTVIAYGVKEKEEEKPVVSTPSNNNTSSSNSSKPSNKPSSTNKPSSSNNSSGSNNNYSSGKYAHPLKGAGRISSTYGPRWGTFHYGIDYAAPAGTPIYAARAGKVIYSAYNNGGYGKLIIIEHSDGTQSYYAHCSSLYVPVGTKVNQGDRIAGVGTTGDSTGNHLHFEIRVNGRPVNPANYL